MELLLAIAVALLGIQFIKQHKSDEEFGDDLYIEIDSLSNRIYEIGDELLDAKKAKKRVATPKKKVKS